MKSGKYIIKIVMLLILQLMIFNNTIYASFWSDILNDGRNFIEEGASEQSNSNSILKIEDKNIKEIINDLYGILFPLGVAITVIVGGVLGIKFMTASAEDKAKIKESMMPFVWGCVVIYGAFGIWRIVLQIVNVLN